MSTLLYQGHGSLRLTTDSGKVIYIDPFAGEGYDAPAMPVYSQQQYNEMIALQKPVIEEIGNTFEIIQESVTTILTNHVPVHLKKSVGEIAAMSLFHDGTYLPASLLVQNGFLSTDWIPGEIATSYVVMK